MPKRKKRHTARSQQRAEGKKVAARKQKQRKAGKQPKPNQKRQYIYSSEETPEAPTLGARFAGLPPELRAEIFAWLLVRPVKWSATHYASCPLLSPALTTSPFQDIRPRLSLRKSTCAALNLPATRWRHRTKPVHADPWRSLWAPVVRNEFLCSGCWDMRHRADPCPRVDSLPCLCARARRTDGLAALLVCRAWYEEGARVLYGRNVFAFASPAECIAFFGALNPRWRVLVSKVSLLALAPPGEYPESAAEELEGGRVDVRALREAWGLLSRLPALSDLELDALFLTRPDCVRVFRGVSLKNLRRINFTQSTPMLPAEAPREFVWPRRAFRTAAEDSDFAMDVARVIKGCRYGWIKGEDRGDAQAVENERKRYPMRLKTVTIQHVVSYGKLNAVSSAVDDVVS